jgi:hypothetical protein
MTYEPIDTLGSTTVEQAYSFNSTIILETTSTGTNTTIETIESISVDYGTFPNIFDYISHNIVDNIITFSGNFSLAVFDLYSLKYVDKGSSDKIMEPIITNIADMPDSKDLFEINIDTRQNINIPLIIDIIIKETTTDSELPAAEPIVNLVNYSINYNIIVNQNRDLIKNWIKDYFENRYN